ncbi:MAG: NUDIX domain-containing protein [Bacteroidales bacterium]
MTEVRFYEPYFVPDGRLIYSVITAKYRGQWIYVRHRNRETWEIPGGHIEENETSDEAASRELREETGAGDFSLDCVATYSVFRNGETGYGRLYFADIYTIGPVPDISEIAGVKLMEGLPQNLTHPDIQPHLFDKVREYLSTHRPKGING